MASTIAAGTSAGTAIAISGDTSGSLVLQTNGTTTAVTISTAQVVTLAQPLPVASGGSGVTTSTGSAANLLGTSPTLVTPILGTPTSGNLANCTGIPAPAALSTASGSAPSYSARAWVNFNGTLTTPITPRGSGNVSSVTKNATGDFYINFTTAMPDANYSIVGVGSMGAGFTDIRVFGNSTTNPTTASCRMFSQNSSNNVTVDCPYSCAEFFR